MNWFSADKDASTLTEGASAPLGATVCPGGVNFSVFAKHADLIELLLFDHADAAKPTQVISLQSDKHRTDGYWHVFVPVLQPGQVYGISGSRPVCAGTRLAVRWRKVVGRPLVVVPDRYDRWAAARPGDNTAVAMRSVVADPTRYDWEDDRPLSRPVAETVIYELHVAGFHPTSQLEGRADKAWDLRGVDRQNTLPQGPWRHRRGTAADLSV